jgi:hypothetical protein
MSPPRKRSIEPNLPLFAESIHVIATNRSARPTTFAVDGSLTCVSTTTPLRGAVDDLAADRLAAV